MGVKKNGVKLVMPIDVQPLRYPDSVVSPTTSFASPGYLDLRPFRRARLYLVLADGWNVTSRLSRDGTWNPTRELYCKYTIGKGDYVLSEGLHRFQKQMLLRHSAVENHISFSEAMAAQAIANLSNGIPIVTTILQPLEFLLDAPDWIAIRPSHGALVDVRVVAWYFPEIPEIGDYPEKEADLPEGERIPANGNAFPPDSDTSGGPGGGWEPSNGGNYEDGLPEGADRPEKPTDRTGVWWVYFTYYDACVPKTLWKSLGDDDPSSQPRKVEYDLGVVQNPCGARDRRIDFFRDSTFLTYGTGGDLTAAELRYVPKGQTPS